MNFQRFFFDFLKLQFTAVRSKSVVAKLSLHTNFNLAEYIVYPDGSAIKFRSNSLIYIVNS